MLTGSRSFEYVGHDSGSKQWLRNGGEGRPGANALFINTGRACASL